MRILIAGRPGAGKTTLAGRLASALDIPYLAMDPVLLGADMTRRAGWRNDVELLANGLHWVTELHYPETLEALVPRAQLLIWVDPGLARSYLRLVKRTFRRSVRRTEVWPGFREPSLRSVLWRRDHILRWALRAAELPGELVAAARVVEPSLEIIRIRRDSETRKLLVNLTRSFKTKGEPSGPVR